MLDELLDIGAAATVRPIPARAQVWAATPVDRVIAELAHRRRDAVSGLRRLHRQLASPAELNLDPAGGGVRLISSPTAAQYRLQRLTEADPRELLSMNPDPVVSAAAVRNAAAAHAALIRRRVVIRDLSVPPGQADATGELTRELAAGGCQFRELPSLPARFVIFDRSTALVRLDPLDPARGIVEVTDASTVGALVERFLRHWESAADSAGSAPVNLTSRERAVVRLLVAGRTDAEAAAELGLSARTVAYTVRGLLDRFGVTNRFQLGLALGPIVSGWHRPAGHPNAQEADP